MIFETETRTQAISREQVWRAWKRIRQGGRATGVDGLSIAEIDSNPRKYLYPLWNRMSSGSYFPPAVREVEIPKGDGKTRKLGIPTILDRVAQEVIREELEGRIEPQFLPGSFAYRPCKSAHQALEQCARHCWERWYVVDIDIKGFFDNLNHEHMMRILAKYTHERHHLLYIKRWLQAPIQQKDGQMVRRTKGTPQGGVISPLIANLYLHECFDLWMAREHGNMVYERYADDIVIHTRSREQSDFIYDRLKQRLIGYGLTLNEEKSRIVYCYRTARFRKESKDMPVSFDFLGYTFKPCRCERADKVKFCGYRPCMSTKSKKKILEQIRKMQLHRRAASKLTAIAKELNPKVKGWIQYYGQFRRSELSKVFYRLNQRLILWIKDKHKFTGIRRAVRYLRNINKSFPSLFVHWEYGFKV
jgi:group II intron reverse transcriptase/maturase